MSHTATMSDIELRCLVEGDSTTFQVTAPLNADIMINDLKKLIHERGINVTECTIRAKDLVVLKVCML